MASPPIIHSRQNPTVKNLVRLRERKHRDRQGLCLIEGLREIDHALRAGIAAEQLFFCPERFPADGGHEAFLSKLRERAGVEPAQLGPEAFDKAAYRESPDGLIAVARQSRPSLDALELPEAPLLLVLEGLEKPGNLGAAVRNADGAGAHAVILVNGALDRFNPNAIRASQGLIFALPVLEAEASALRAWLRARGIAAVATTPTAQSPPWELDLRAPTALLLGAEHAGLSRHWIETADAATRIPMAGAADSLNVSASAAVCLYEARRQRGARGARQGS